MKTDAFCDVCRKVVKVKSVNFSGFCCNVYLKCGHDIHLGFASRSTPDHNVLGKPSFIYASEHAEKEDVESRE